MARAATFFKHLKHKGSEQTLTFCAKVLLCPALLTTKILGMSKHLLLGLLFLLSALHLSAQETTVYTEALTAYKRGETFLQQNLYAKAQQEFLDAIQLLRPVQETEAEMLLAQAEFNYAKMAVQLGQPDGEKLILDFIRRYHPEPIANQALIEIANYYFNQGEYEKALEFYERVPNSGLTRDERAEVAFRQGYAYFVRKDFRRAKQYFLRGKDIQNEFYYPTNYYLGLIEFYEGDYDAAVRQFRIVERSNTYDDYVPYYLTQIYFAQRRFDELVAYAKPKLAARGIRNETEMQQLVGQAYFEKGDYQSAKPYLEYYAQNSRSLREEELYQLGYVQFQTGDYSKAAEAFREISGVDSPLGQMANYYLADTYLRARDARSARSAFGNAMRMTYDPLITEDATWNYAKLSYELRDPREAVSALQSMGPTSRYYVDAQRLLGDIFLSYRDYEQALTVLQSIPNKTPELQEAYQRVSFLRGLQLLKSDDLAGAKLMLNQALQRPLDPQYRAQTLYWLAEIANREGNYDESISLNNQFLTLARTVSDLPPQSSLYTGNYLQGYNYLKKENYPAALDYFRAAVEGIKRNETYIADTDVRERVLGDAVLRTGDAYFKRNQYNQAITYYDEAVTNRYPGFIYALYQKAIIEGLRGNTAQKILALENIANQYPRSEYADDALFQLGLTYQSLNQLQKALTPFRQIVDQYKTSSTLVNESLLQLGLVNYNLGNQEAAINYYKQVFSNNPTVSEGNRARASLEEIYVRDMGRADLYFAFLETIPGYNTENISRDSINFAAAEAQFENGNYQRAVEAYTTYIRQFPKGLYLLPSYYHRGESYAVLRQYAQALADYEYVVSRGPSSYYLKALEKAAIIAYNAEQDFQKAYQLYTQLEQAADNESLRFEAQLGAMRSAYRAGNSGAVATQAAKVANNPNATAEQRTTANFFLGKIAYDREDYANALTYFDQVIANSDNEQTAEARYLRANIYYLRRDLTRAKQLTLAANQESSDYPFWVAKSVILLADILRDQNDLYNARAALEALLDNYQGDPAIIQEARQKLTRVQNEIQAGSRLQPNTPATNNFMEIENGGN